MVGGGAWWGEQAPLVAPRRRMDARSGSPPASRQAGFAAVLPTVVQPTPASSVRHWRIVCSCSGESPPTRQAPTIHAISPSLRGPAPRGPWPEGLVPPAWLAPAPEGPASEGGRAGSGTGGSSGYVGPFADSYSISARMLTGHEAAVPASSWTSITGTVTVARAFGSTQL